MKVCNIILILIVFVEAKYEIYLDRVENSPNNTMQEYEYVIPEGPRGCGNSIDQGKK
jgi:hypothetical protein